MLLLEQTGTLQRTHSSRLATARRVAPCSRGPPQARLAQVHLGQPRPATAGKTTPLTTQKCTQEHVHIQCTRQATGPFVVLPWVLACGTLANGNLHPVPTLSVRKNTQPSCCCCADCMPRWHWHDRRRRAWQQQHRKRCIAPTALRPPLMPRHAQSHATKANACRARRCKCAAAAAVPHQHCNQQHTAAHSQMPATPWTPPSAPLAYSADEQ